MKWNWGTKIFIAIILFMSMMIVLVILTMKQSYYLVEKDYYPKALEYQQRIDKETNAKNVGEMVLVENNSNGLLITFPAAFNPESISGEMVFYRPSDGTKDIAVPIQLDSLRKMTFPTRDLMTGRYILKFEYEVNKTGYYQENTIYIEK